MVAPGAYRTIRNTRNSSESATLLRRWGRLHAVRSAASFEIQEAVEEKLGRAPGRPGPVRLTKGRRGGSRTRLTASSIGGVPVDRGAHGCKTVRLTICHMRSAA